MKSPLLKFNKIKAFKDVINKNSGLKITNVNEGYVLNLIALDYLKNDKTVFLVLPNITLAQKFYDELSLILPDEDILFYPADEFLTSILSLSSVSFKTERIYTLSRLLTEKKQLVVLNQQAAMYKTLEKESWLNAIIQIKKGKRFIINELANKLVNIGYKREYTVVRTGEFSVRGSIVDIFPIGFENLLELIF